MSKFIGINLSLVTTHSVCGVRRVWSLGWRGYTSLVDQVMRCLNLKSIMTLAVSGKYWNNRRKRVGTLTVGISTRYGYDSRTFFTLPRCHQLDAEVCLMYALVWHPPTKPVQVAFLLYLCWPLPPEGASDKHRGKLP